MPFSQNPFVTKYVAQELFRIHVASQSPVAIQTERSTRYLQKPAIGSNQEIVQSSLRSQIASPQDRFQYYQLIAI
jgi:hypothetical protein